MYYCKFIFYKFYLIHVQKWQWRRCLFPVPVLISLSSAELLKVSTLLPRSLVSFHLAALNATFEPMLLSCRSLPSLSRKKRKKEKTKNSPPRRTLPLCLLASCKTKTTVLFPFLSFFHIVLSSTWPSRLCIQLLAHSSLLSLLHFWNHSPFFFHFRTLPSTSPLATVETSVSHKDAHLLSPTHSCSFLPVFRPFPSLSRTLERVCARQLAFLSLGCLWTLIAALAFSFCFVLFFLRFLSSWLLRPAFVAAHDSILSTVSHD